MLVALGVTAGLPLAGPAAAQDALRCEAARLRWEARQMDCVGRCEDRAADRMGNTGRAGITEEKAAQVYAKMNAAGIWSGCLNGAQLPRAVA